MAKKATKTTKNAPVKVAEVKTAPIKTEEKAAVKAEVKTAEVKEKVAPVTAANCPAEFDAIWKLVEETAKTYEKPAADYFLAVQVNLTGEKGGTFYIALRNGNIDVAPYDYHDRSCGITISPENFLKLMDGKLDAVLAFTTGKIKVDGDVGKALEFSKIVKANSK